MICISLSADGAPGPRNRDQPFRCEMMGKGHGRDWRHLVMFAASFTRSELQCATVIIEDASYCGNESM